MSSQHTAHFTDEHIHHRLAAVLRERGFDALSCQEAGRHNQGIDDEDQLAYAAEQGRAILTFNSVDFVPLDLLWKQMGRTHAGIIVAPALRDFSRLLQRVELHLTRYSRQEHENTLLWLA